MVREGENMNKFIYKMYMKWIKGNCRHFCIICKYKDICDIFRLSEN